MGTTQPAVPAYTAPPETVTFDGLLFDMDGTIIDSTNAVVKHWETVGKEIGVDPEVILQTSHGRRSIDMLKVLAPEKANWEYVQHMEGLLPKYHAEDAVEIPGARSLLQELIVRSSPWAIVTSGTVPSAPGDDKQVLVLEDSPAGIRSGKEAGCKVLAVVTSHTVEQVLSAGPDWVVRDLDSVRVVRGGGEVVLEIRDALVV
ncbi:DL-glycerol-3-phosphatase [Collariella sp. IMI 366227]|nr:DL-glycerol-3-phosphatase [Collariella sp. IMI 366227]